ncbi:MAG: hypothetical protein GYA36_17120 [Veillonellaceae bacterium]|nr:hypothetical protein [Veillonellaceae bacterium]
MNKFSLILDFGVITLIAGVFLVSFRFLSELTELATRIWRRIFMIWARRQVRLIGIVREDAHEGKARIDTKRLSILILIPLLSIAVRDLLLSPLILGFGLIIFLWMNFQEHQGERSRVNEDAEIAALQIRSLLSVDRSLLNALNGITLPEGELKKSLQKVVSRLQMHQPPEQAVQALHGLPGNVTARLAALIGNSARITDEIQASLLVALEQEAHRQKLLRSKMTQTLALVRGTIRLLQGVVAAALVFVLLSPTWRDFFLQDIPHRTLLTVLLICSVLASLYFEYEVYQLGSGEAF